jgi:hypothetical protein
MYTYLFIAFIGMGAIIENIEGWLALEHCKVLFTGGVSGGCAYIRSLGESGNTRLLRSLYLAEGYPMISSYAATVASCSIRDADVVAFCKQFKINSPNWEAVFETLKDRPKTTVMPYIRMVSTTGDAKARYRCYRVCWSAGWGDLLQQASSDLADETIVDMIFPNPIAGVRLKEEAEYYVKRFSEQK